MSKVSSGYKLYSRKPKSFQFKDLGFTHSKAQEFNPTISTTSVTAPRTSGDTFFGRIADSVSSFNESLNPVFKELLSKQRYNIPVSKDKNTTLTLGRVGTINGEPSLGFKVTKVIK